MPYFGYQLAQLIFLRSIYIPPINDSTFHNNTISITIPKTYRNCLCIRQENQGKSPNPQVNHGWNHYLQKPLPIIQPV